MSHLSIEAKDITIDIMDHYGILYNTIHDSKVPSTISLLEVCRGDILQVMRVLESNSAAF